MANSAIPAPILVPDLVSTGGSEFVPAMPTNVSASPTLGNALTSAVNEKVAYIFYAPITGSITKLHFTTQTVATGGVAWDIRLETMDETTGKPTGTLVGTNTNASQTIQSTDDDTWFAVTLTAAASVTRGTMYALVIAAPSSGSFSANFAIFADDASRGMPYVLRYTGGAWAGTALTGAPVFALEYGTNTFYPMAGVYPISIINTHTFNNSSTPDIYCNIWNAPYKQSVSGLWFWGDMDGNADVKIIGSDGATVLASRSLDKNTPPDTTAVIHCPMFANDVILEANTNYYLCIEPNSATNLTLYSYDFYTSYVKNQFPQGQYMTYATAKNPVNTASWTTNASRMLVCGLQRSGIIGANYG